MNKAIAGRLSALIAPISYLRRFWLVRSSAIFVGLGLLRGVSQFAFVMVMTRIMAPFDYGLYSNFLYTTAILSPLFFLKSDVPVARHYASDPQSTPTYIGTVVILCSGITIISSFALWFSEPVVHSLTGIGGAWQFLILITCWSYGLFLVVLAVLQIELRAWAMAISRIAPNMTCELAAMLIVFLTGGGWREALAAYAAISALWGAAFFRWLIRFGYLRFKFSRQSMMEFLSIGAPLIPMSIGFMCVQISSQFILTRYSGPGEVGIYAAANQFAMGVWLLAMSSQQAFMPWLFKTLKKQNSSEDYKVVAATIGIILTLAICTIAYIVIFQIIFPHLVGKKFTAGGQLLSPLAQANFFLGVQMTMNCFLYFRKKTMISAIAVCMAAICGLVIGVWEIPIGGAAAAARVTEISAALAAIFTTIATLWSFAPIAHNGLRDAVVRLKALVVSR